MLKAIQEASIPIDMVGGVSIGAFMGALWCAERNLTIVTVNKLFFRYFILIELDEISI